MDETNFSKDSKEVISNVETFSGEFTPSMVQVIAERHWHRDVHVLDYVLDFYMDERKVGIIKLHRCLQIITAKEGGRISPRNFFVKFMPQYGIRNSIVLQLGVFEKEVLFYKEVLPLLQKEYQAEAWSPQFYLEMKKVIVLEDLKAKGLRMCSKILDKKDTMLALSAIARMHAASLLAEKRLGKSLLEICPKAFNTDMYYDKDGEWLKWFQAGVSFTRSLAIQLDFHPDVFDRIPAAFEKIKRIHEPSPLKHNVITHSDLWNHNLMFDDNSPPKCIIFDYQMIRYCPMGADFIMFLHLCTSRDFRRRYKQEMMKHYYDIMYNTMKSHDSQIKVPEWSEFVVGVEEYTFSAAANAILHVSWILKDETTFAEAFADEEVAKKFMDHHNGVAVFELMKRNSYYNERIREAFTEFVEMSQKLDQFPLPR